MLVYQRVVSGLPAWEFYHFYIFVLSELWMYFWGYGFCTFRWPVQIINVAVIEEIYIYILNKKHRPTNIENIDLLVFVGSMSDHFSSDAEACLVLCFHHVFYPL